MIKIAFSQNVRYRRCFPPDRGNVINIYFDDISLSRDTQREKNVRTPLSDLVPPFWAEHLRNEAGDASFEPIYVAVKFSETVNFSQRADEGSRAFYLLCTHYPASKQNQRVPCSGAGAGREGRRIGYAESAGRIIVSNGACLIYTERERVRNRRHPLRRTARRLSNLTAGF